MDFFNNLLEFDLKAAKKEIVDLIQDRFRYLDRKYAVIELSGRLDSSLSAVLTVKSLCPEKVKLYYLPERDSKSIHKKQAQILSRKLGVEHKVVAIRPALRALRIYSLLPLSIFPGQWLKSRAVDYGRSRFL